MKGQMDGTGYPPAEGCHVLTLILSLEWIWESCGACIGRSVVTQVGVDDGEAGYNGFP
jgi:hypothetical protein